MTQKDELAGVIADELNKTFKHQKVAYFLDEGSNPTMLLIGFQQVQQC